VILETPRLSLREATLEDDAFILALLNAPGFVSGIGDRGVRSLDEARNYIETRILSSYRDHGFGMWVVTAKGQDQPAGLCGLVRRDVLPHVDLGYALLERQWGRGYAQEAAAAVLAHARGALGLATVAAIVNPDNAASRRVLEKIGFRFIDVRHLDGWDQPSAYYQA